MQVDEERKGAAAADLDVGGYEDDSDDEREIKEQEEGAKDIHLNLNEAAGGAQGATSLLVCQSSPAQCLAKIMYGAHWAEIGEATTTKTSTKGEVAAADKGPKTVLKLYSLSSGALTVIFALPEDKLSTDMINPIVGQIFG